MTRSTQRFLNSIGITSILKACAIRPIVWKNYLSILQKERYEYKAHTYCLPDHYTKRDCPNLSDLVTNAFALCHHNFALLPDLRQFYRLSNQEYCGVQLYPVHCSRTRNDGGDYQFLL